MALKCGLFKKRTNKTGNRDKHQSGSSLDRFLNSFFLNIPGTNYPASCLKRNYYKRTKSMKTNRIYTTVTLLFIIYIAAVFFFCLYNVSGDSIDMGKYILGIRLDRIFHFLMFFPYPFIGWMFFNYNKRIKIYRQYMFAVIILSGILLASFSEAAQELFTTYRDGDPYDLGADITGIFAGSLIVYLFKEVFEKIIERIFIGSKRD